MTFEYKRIVFVDRHGAVTGLLSDYEINLDNCCISSRDERLTSSLPLNSKLPVI